MVSVCDKCRVRKVEKVIRLENREVELCSQCYYHIIEWLEKPEKRTFLGGFLGGKNE